MTEGNIKNQLGAFAASFDESFASLLAPLADVPASLIEAMHYSALAPGKRLRPYMVVRCCVLTGGRAEDAYAPAAALECMHAFSLIHDDLPAMDDDDLRRGRPTSHVKFGEAMAILAGDALAILPFELLTRHVPDPNTSCRLIAALSRLSGWSGMIGGQVADIQGESEAPSLERVEFIHARKTGCLFEAACRMGAIAAGAEEDAERALGQYGQMLGRAFQIADDLLDVTANVEAMGKRTCKDATASKQTFPRCVGIDRSRTLAREAAEGALGALSAFGEEADDLRALAAFAADRDY